jgi:hypothetical protein
MRARFSLLLAVVASLQLGAPCGVNHKILIGSPGGLVSDFSFQIQVHVLGPIQP